MLKAALLAATVLLASASAPAQTPPPAAAAYDRAVAKSAVAKLVEEIEANFVYDDVAKRYAARLRERLAAGAYDAPANADALAKLVTADLQAVAPDGHLHMRAPGGPRPGPRPVPASEAPPRHPPAMEQAGWIAPGIAFVRFNVFMGAPETLAAFRSFLDTHAGAKALIIDARTHGGGGLDEMDVLFPRIFDKPQTVMVMDTRASVAARGFRLPFASLVKVDAPPAYARAEHRVTPGAASPWRGARVYYLTSGRTGSAAEHLAAVFKGTGRATLVGETTAGAGNFGGEADLPGGYMAFIPFGHSYYPGTAGWEGTGVEPDIKVAPERALYETLVREGVAPEEAERLSASHMPSGAMVRRR